VTPPTVAGPVHVPLSALAELVWLSACAAGDKKLTANNVMIATAIALKVNRLRIISPLTTVHTR
jgi:hypothetical protein